MEECIPAVMDALRAGERLTAKEVSQMWNLNYGAARTTMAVLRIAGAIKGELVKGRKSKRPYNVYYI
jgi:hypothetical protein